MLQPSPEPEEGTAAGLRGDALLPSALASVLEKDCGSVGISGSSSSLVVSTNSFLALPPSPVPLEASPRSHYNTYLSWAQLHWPGEVGPPSGMYSDHKAEGMSFAVCLRRGELMSSAHESVAEHAREGAGMRDSRSSGGSFISTVSSLSLPPSPDTPELSPRSRYDAYVSWVQHHWPAKVKPGLQTHSNPEVVAIPTEVFLLPQHAPCYLPEVVLAMLSYAMHWLQAEHDAAIVQSPRSLSGTGHSECIAAGTPTQCARSLKFMLIVVVH